ncbi:MAG: HDIG domain-containing protein [Thermoplasmata archaeon]|jgi:uncharacterized protein (TIGR00295 family)|nr:HDIG domain-containing protein [Thermoplasmata archaeon]
MLRANGCPENVIEHCEAVAELAVKIARRCGADPQLVEAGALLHDIGRCRTHSVMHAVEGAKTVSDMGLSPELVSIVERHIGAGLTRSDARQLGLPEKDYIPITLEEKVVAQADNLIAASGRVSLEVAIADVARRVSPEAASRIRALHEELSRACGVDLDEIQ